MSSTVTSSTVTSSTRKSGVRQAGSPQPGVHQPGIHGPRTSDDGTWSATLATSGTASGARTHLPAHRDPEPPGRRRTRLSGPREGTGTSGVLFAMCLSLVLVVSSVSMLNLALPDIAVSLRATNTNLTWIADAFTVALAGLVLPFGELGDRYGRRTLLVAGNVVFGAAALAASRVHTPDHLIALRAVMGLGAAMIMPGTLSTITATFPPERRDRGVAVWSGFATAGAILGMLAAGGLLRHWSWRSIFVASAITAVVAAASALLLAPNTRDEHPAPLDVAGGTLLAIGIGCLVYAIIESNDSSWTATRVVVASIVCAVAVLGWVLVDVRSTHPILDPRLFLLRGFTAGTIALVAQFMSLFGFFFVGLQYLQLMLGYSALKAAVALVPVALVVLPVTLATPRLTRRVGMRVLMTAGLVCIAVGMGGLYHLSTGSGYRPFLLGLLAAGLGLGLCSATGTVAITGALPASRQGVASAMNDVTREVGSAIGIAVMGSTYSKAYTNGLPDLSRFPASIAAATHDSAAGGLAAAQQLMSGHPHEGALLADGVRHAFIHGFTRSFLVVAIIVLAAAVVTMVLTPSRRAGSTQDADSTNREHTAAAEHPAITQDAAGNPVPGTIPAARHAAQPDDHPYLPRHALPGSTTSPEEED